MKNYLKISIFLYVIFVFLTGLSALVFQKIAIKNQISDFSLHIQRIQENIKIHNNTWDLAQYNADPQMPYPNGSSGYPNSLYIITTDGFVIERNRPINGLFDSSDFKTFINYKTPETIQSSTDEQWRVLAQQIATSQPEGMIIASYYNPSENTERIDTLLVETVKQLESLITVTDKGIDISNIDIRNVHYEVSFEIINNFNIVLINNGRTPSFVDPSYVAQYLEHTGAQFFTDQETKEQYVLNVQPLIDTQGNTEGIIVLGRSISGLQKTIYEYLKFFSVLSLIFAFVAGYIVPLVIKRINATRLKTASIRNISFDRQSGQLKIDMREIKIPLNSNQYELCKLLFNNPKKRWENDQIMDILGEPITKDSWRKIYDTMLTLNKKTQIKLILYQGKKIFFNPEYSQAIISTKK